MLTTTPAQEVASNQISATPFELLLLFNRLQSSRVQVYKDFETGFALYLNNEANADEYQALVAKITSLFSSLSQEIQDVERLLKEGNQALLGQLVREVQELERQKLEQTVKLQIYKVVPNGAALPFYPLKFNITPQTETTFGSRDYTSDIEHLQSSLEDTIESINDKLAEIQNELAELDSTE
ncbi:hypothetical protein HK104_001319 [Borealophlyctis nickersoniae]|nr:hypothetical protein HK104_001319 [Borealophlyctis nickersoniae]